MIQVDRPLFYGWIVVAAAFAVLFTAFGAAYSFPAFFLPLQTEFSASRGLTALVFSLAGFLYFVLGAVSGPLADRYGPRPVVGFGLACIVAGMFFAGRADNLNGVLLAYGLGVGTGVGFAYVPAIAAVQRWFIVRRGQASGYAVMGIGVGTMVAPPVANLLVQELTWRGAYTALAAAVAVLALLAVPALRGRPEEMGLRPDGAAMPVQAEGGGTATGTGGYTLQQALRQRAYWILYISCGIYCIGTFVPFVHIVAYSRDLGHDPALALYLVGIIGFGSTAGRFLLGPVADRVGRGRALAGTMLLSGLMLGIWLVSTSLLALAGFALGFGIFYGGFVALVPAYTIDLFGTRSASTIIGVLYTSVAFGTLLGPTLAGVAFDISHSYTLPISVCAATSILAALAVARMPQRLAPAPPEAE